MKTGKKNKPTENITSSKRTFTTEVRVHWQDHIKNVVKVIDEHNSMAMIKRLDGDGGFHGRQSAILQQYILNLKTWIKENEKNISK